MRRNNALFFIVAILFPTCVFSLYNGNTALPDMPEEAFFLSKNSFISLKSGYEGDFLLGRNIGVSADSSDPWIHSMLNGGTLSLGFINRLELYTLLGASKSKVVVQSAGQEVELKTAQNFGGEVGIRANTPVWRDMKFGVDAKYFYAWPEIDYLQVAGQRIKNTGRVFQKEWQVGLSVSQTFAWFSPYVGVKFCRFRMKFIDLTSLADWIPSEQVSIYNKSPFGFFVGLGISAVKGFYFNFESRFVDEYAISGAFGCSF